MRHSKSSLFLMEMIVGILFFLIASAVCIEVFVKANVINNKSIHLNDAKYLTSNVIEMYKTGSLSDNQELYYNQSLQQCLKQEAVYCISYTINDGVIDLEVKYKDEFIYSIDYFHYFKQSLGDEGL